MEPAVPEPTQARDTGDRRLLMMAVVVAGHGVKHLYNSSFFVLLPELKLGLGLTNAGLGSVSAFRNVAGGVTNLPAGFLGDRFQSRWSIILALSLAIVGLSYVAVGSVRGLGLLIVVATVMNVGVTLWHPSAISALSRRFSERRGFAIAVHGTGGSAGEALGPLVAGGLLLLMGWRLVFRAMGLPAVAAGSVVWLLLRQVPVSAAARPSIRDYLASVRRLLGNRRLPGILVVVAGFGATQSPLVTFLPVYLQIELEYSPTVMSFYIFASQAAGIATQPLLGFLSDRHGRQSVLLPSLLALAAASLGVSLVSPGLPLLLVIVFMGAFVFPLMAILLAAAADVAGEGLQATAVSIVFATTVVFSGLSPYVSGLLADAFGVVVVFRYAAGVALATGVILAVQRWDRPPSAGGP